MPTSSSSRTISSRSSSPAGSSGTHIEATSCAASPPEAPAPVSPRLVLRRMGIEATRLRVIARRHNVHWLAETRSGRVVLRRYAPRRTRAEVDYELRVLEELRARGWPVAVAQ